MKIEAMNTRQWDDSACEMHVKHSMKEEYKDWFNWFHKKWYDLCLNFDSHYMDSYYKRDK